MTSDTWLPDVVFQGRSQRHARVTVGEFASYTPADPGMNQEGDEDMDHDISDIKATLNEIEADMTGTLIELGPGVGPTAEEWEQKKRDLEAGIVQRADPNDPRWIAPVKQDDCIGGND